jgi:hypothetical protein
MTRQRVVFWAKTERIRLEHIPALSVTRLIERGTELVLAEVHGHPSDPATHDALAVALRSEAYRSELYRIRPVCFGGRRPAA